MINGCHKKVTESFFIHVCQENYDQCVRYAAHRERLRRPIEWLVHVAVQTESYVNGLKATAEGHLKDE